MILSVVIITHNEEANIGRALASVQPLVADGKGEIIVVDSGSTDRTVEIAKSYGAKVFIEEWKGYAAQKNSAIDKASCVWILSLDADEEVEPALAADIGLSFPQSREEALARAGEGSPVAKESLREAIKLAKATGLLAKSSTAGVFFPVNGFWIPRKNFFLGRWIKHGGFWPDPKLRLFRKGATRFEERLVHEDARLIEGISPQLNGALLHHSYHEPLFVPRRRDGNRQGSPQLQRVQHRPAPVGHLHLQLFFSPRFSRWPRRTPAAPLPRGLRLVEVREGLGTRAPETIKLATPLCAWG
jgi:hypothetical protein